MKKVIIIIASLMLIAGLVFVLFEPVSTQINSYTAGKIADEFDEAVKQAEKTEKKKPKKSSENRSQNTQRKNEVTKESLKALLKDSIKYNKNIFSNQGTVSTSEYTSAALNLKKYGIYDNIYGYISAPSIGMKLPIYLGANDAMLSHGAAHLCNTSLPLSGENVNCVLAGHTGYRGRVFFDNLSGLSIGSRVSVKTYFETLNYKVIKKHKVSPDNTNDVYIRPGRNLLTLVTCVSRGNGKFDRYIVVCEKN